MSIMANDVKKGATVRLKDGRTVQVIDNQKGIIRAVKAEVIGMAPLTESGSMYIDEWKSLEEKGKLPVDILMSEQQAARMKQIRAMGF